MKRFPPPLTFKPLRYLKREQWDDEYIFPDLTDREVIPISSEPMPGEQNTSEKGTEVTMDLPIRNIIFSYTGTSVCNNFDECKAAMKKMQKESIAKNMPDLPYNFLVGGDGTVYEGRGWLSVPEVNERYDQLHGNSMEIAYFGRKGRTPPIVQALAAWDFVQYSVKTTVCVLRPLFFTVYH